MDMAHERSRGRVQGSHKALGVLTVMSSSGTEICEDRDDRDDDASMIHL